MSRRSPSLLAPLLGVFLDAVLEVSLGVRAKFALAVCLLGLSCTYYVDRGSDLYNQGRYIEAAHVLEKTEGRLALASHQQQAAYGLYRGATLLKLGDLDRAEVWLGYARNSEIQYPGSLTVSELQLLREALIVLRVDLERRAAGRN